MSTEETAERADVSFVCADCDGQTISFTPAKQLANPNPKQLAVMTLMAMRAHRRATHQDDALPGLPSQRSSEDD